MRKSLLLIALLPAIARAWADDDDKLCEVIGEAPNISVPPKDRLFFKENCTCMADVGCGKVSSNRWSARVAVMEEVRKKKAEDEARVRKLEVDVEAFGRQRAAELKAEEKAEDEARARKRAAEKKVVAKKPVKVNASKREEVRQSILSAFRNEPSEEKRSALCAQKFEEHPGLVFVSTYDYCQVMEGEHQAFTTCRNFMACQAKKEGECAAQKTAYETACQTYAAKSLHICWMFASDEQCNDGQ
jgi:hypothetical protein